MATLNGADLWMLGIPGHSISTLADSRRRIGRAGGASTFVETGGTWSRVDPREWDDLLGDLLFDEEYVRDLFRLVAVQRRRVQEATATWAPVMLTAGPLADDLGEFRRLADALEMLQESIRACGSIGGGGVFAPTPTWSGSVRGRFWDADRRLRAAARRVRVARRAPERRDHQPSQHRGVGRCLPATASGRARRTGRR